MLRASGRERPGEFPGGSSEEIHFPCFRRAGWGCCSERGSGARIPIPNSDLEPPWGVGERVSLAQRPRLAALPCFPTVFFTSVPEAHQPPLRTWNVTQSTY